METTFAASVRLWFFAGNPDTSVHNEFNIFADVGDRFYNTSTNIIFICTQGGESQVWQQVAYQSAKSQSTASRTLNSGFQVSTSRDALVNYSVDIQATISLTTGQSGTVFLEIATNSGFTTGLQELARFVNGNTGTLALGLSLTQNVTGTLSGYVPSGYYARLRTSNTTGVPTYNYRSGQEVLL